MADDDADSDPADEPRDVEDADAEPESETEVESESGTDAASEGEADAEPERDAESEGDADAKSTPSGAPPTSDPAGFDDEPGVPLEELKREFEARVEAGDDPEDEADEGEPDEGEATGTAALDEGEFDREAPLGDLASRIEAEAPPEDDPFEDMSVSEADAEIDWDELVEGEAEPAGGPTAARAEPVAPEEHVVDKRQFCQRCDYFSAPPETACTHEGTEIVEVVDSDHFRVRDCPMVGEDGEPDFRAEERD